MDQIIGFLKACFRGEEAALQIDKTLKLGWADIGAILIIFSLCLYLF